MKFMLAFSYANSGTYAQCISWHLFSTHHMVSLIFENWNSIFFCDLQVSATLMQVKAKNMPIYYSKKLELKSRIILSMQVWVRTSAWILLMKQWVRQNHNIGRAQKVSYMPIWHNICSTVLFSSVCKSLMALNGTKESWSI